MHGKLDSTQFALSFQQSQDTILPSRQRSCLLQLPLPKAYTKVDNFPFQQVDKLYPFLDGWLVINSFPLLLSDRLTFYVKPWVLCHTCTDVSEFLQPRSALKNVRNVERRLTKIRRAGGVAPTRCAGMFTIAERNAKGGWKHTNWYALSTQISTRHVHTCSKLWLTYTQIHTYRLNWKQHKVVCGQDPTVEQKSEHMCHNICDRANETNPDLLSDEQQFKKVRRSI